MQQSASERETGPKREAEKLLIERGGARERDEQRIEFRGAIGSKGRIEMDKPW